MTGSIRKILILILTALLLVACNLPHNGTEGKSARDDGLLEAELLDKSLSR